FVSDGLALVEEPLGKFPVDLSRAKGTSPPRLRWLLVLRVGYVGQGLAGLALAHLERLGGDHPASLGSLSEEKASVRPPAVELRAVFRVPAVDRLPRGSVILILPRGLRQTNPVGGVASL